MKSNKYLISIIHSNQISNDKISNRLCHWAKGEILSKQLPPLNKQ